MYDGQDLTSVMEGEISFRRKGWVRTVQTTNPGLATEIIRLPEAQAPMARSLHTLLAVLTGKGILSLEGPAWKEARFAFTPMFKHGVIDQRFLPIIALKLDAVAAELEAKQNQNVSVFPLATSFATTIIGEGLFGDNQTLSPENMALADEIQAVALQRKRLSLWSRISILSHTRGLSLPLPAHVHKPIPATSPSFQAVSTRADASRQATSAPVNMLDEMVRMTDKGTGKPLFSNAAIYDHISSLIAAGFFTTQTTLGFCLSELLKHPEVLEKVRAEAQPAGSELPADYEGAYPLTTAVVKEVLRLHPPVRRIMRDMKTDFEFGGHPIPRGTIVNVDVEHMHRNPRFFESPDSFNPDRFLGNRQNPAGYMPFGHGSHICMGMRLAQMEAVHLVQRLTRDFDFAVKRDFTGHRHNSIFMEPRGHLIVVPTPRRLAA